MAHSIAPEAEKILDKEFSVLDKGFVRLIDYLGDDERIAQAARVSYGEGTQTFRQNQGLIDYLLRNDHTSPFEQVNFTFHLKMPIFVARQWLRHRTARVNEISGRYSILKNDFYVPESSQIAAQSEDNKQGRRNEPLPLAIQRQVKDSLLCDQNLLYKAYEDFLDVGLARELARINLPLSLYTEFYWQMDLHNLFHFIRLRMHSHAQMEIREYAAMILDLVEKVCPAACKSFRDHMLGGIRFSKTEIEQIHLLNAGKEPTLKGRALERFNNKLELGHE
ncbi:MAG: FAD-dependent thymidylate synthase [Spirochaetales bacterium]|nr:FAD-dependent thymidylate synthase [Spirochaetales bacterium]